VAVASAIARSILALLFLLIEFFFLLVVKQRTDLIAYVFADLHRLPVHRLAVAAGIVS